MSAYDDPTALRPASAAGVHAAAARLRGVAVRTPLIENETLNARCGARVLVKAEGLQHFGSFKLRGAYNLIAQLPPEVRQRGVVAWSSGNHAQGVAYAARAFGAPATIVMPADAPAAKRDNVLALGAEIIAYDRARDDRETIARRIADERGLAVAPSFDHPAIIEGQGTLAREVVEDAAAMGLTLDAMAICCGGGGLAAGCATLLEERAPAARVFVVEPEGYDEFGASLAAGAPQRADVTRPTLCDAIATPAPGRLTLPILARRGATGIMVTEREVLAAMRFAFDRLKLVVEPGGAVALAAALAGKIDARGGVVAITISGANVDPDVFRLCLDAVY